MNDVTVILTSGSGIHRIVYADADYATNSTGMLIVYSAVARNTLAQFVVWAGVEVTRSVAVSGDADGV